MTKAKELPPLEWLRERFELDAENGRLIRKKALHNRPAGEPVGTLRKDGYYQMGMKRERHLLHRVIYYMATGDNPDGMYIDHINGNRGDNRPENLRKVTIVQNLQHRSKAPSSNKSGHRNVSWNSYWRRWQVSVTVDGKRIQRSFHDLEQAAACAAELRQKHFGEYAGSHT